MLKRIFAFYFILSVPGYAFIPHKKNAEIINHNYYKLGYDESVEGAAWTYHLLSKAFIEGAVKRGNYFKADPKVSTHSAGRNDYKGSGFDRGHLIPASDMKLSRLSMKESFYMSNISPQRPSFNRGIWRKLETRTRKFVLNKGSLHIFNGPIFTQAYSYINGTQIAIPDAFYKILLYESKGSFKAISIIIPNQKQSGGILKFAHNINDVERLTGIDFLWELPDEIEERIESSIDNKFWSSLN